MMPPRARLHVVDTREQRKDRGAFFTPPEIAEFVVNWAVRTKGDRVMEPSVGDAEFLVAAVRRLSALGCRGAGGPEVMGIEIHEQSANVARQRIKAAGGSGRVRVASFFDVAAEPAYNAVVGNPPYIRFQTFTGEMRTKSQEAALRGGVALSGLASSWAAFVVHSALFLKRGGRLGLVLPAELLSVNYAAPVRQFLLQRFRQVELVLFAQQVFPEAEADVLLLLADGYGEEPLGHAIVRQTKNASTLHDSEAGRPWTPPDPAGKWTGSLVEPKAVSAIASAVQSGMFVALEAWGDTTLGMVTGNNKYFALSPERARDLRLGDSELLPLSPPGSSHLRGLSLTSDLLERLGNQGRSTRLFYPRDKPSRAATAYIDAGHLAGVDTAFKCRSRKPWHRVPLVSPPDLFLTCMNADTPRLVANEAGAYFLNSVHGVYLNPKDRSVGRALLPLACLNSITVLHAELVGRAYGGGVLKVEPREADAWVVPSGSFIRYHESTLRSLKRSVSALLRQGKLMKAVEKVDQALFADGEVSAEDLIRIRNARALLARRREGRSESGV